MTPATTDGLRLGAFELLQLLGQGGMGEVWRARHVDQDVPVALKLITADHARDADALADFRGELRAVARLDHPSIVRLYDHGVVDAGAAARSKERLVAGSPYLVMELLTGGALDPRLAPGDWSALRWLLLELLGALAHAHARGLVHRDLNPKNILFAGKGDDRPGLRLTDFGISQVLRGSGDGLRTNQETAADTTLEDDERTGAWGTPHYMAPEQHGGRWRDQGPWTDLYSLGCIAWELATGSRVFDADAVYAVVWSHLHRSPPALEPRLEVPAGFEAWLRRLLAKKPGRRFASAADAAWALRHLDAGPDWSTTPMATTWRLVGEAPRVRARSPLRGAGMRLFRLGNVRLVGRDAELDQLWAQLATVRHAGHPRLVLLHGASGLGKTRLAQALVQRAEELGAAEGVRVDHDPESGGRSALAASLRGLLGCRGLDRASTRARVERVVRSLGAVEPWEWTGLAEIVAPAPVPKSTGEVPTVPFLSAKERNVALRRFLALRAARRPQVLWLDDVAEDERSLALAEHLMAAAPTSVGPVLVLLTVPSEALAGRGASWQRLADLVALPGTVPLRLAPLAAEPVRRMLRELMGLEAGLASLVERRAEGNPRFALELVASWEENGLLRPGPQGLQLVGGEHDTLPMRVEDVSFERVSELAREHGEQALQTLELAAVLGLRVDVFEWNHVCSSARLRADGELFEDMVAHGLAESTEAGWAFASDMLRQCLVRAADEGGRVVGYHALAAAMLERRYLARHPDRARRLARHYEASGDPEAAIEQLGHAAAEASERSANREALAVTLDRERLLTERGAGERDARWGQCLLLRARSALELGRLGDAREALDELERRAARGGWPVLLAEATGLQATLAQLDGDSREAGALLSEALRLCPDDSPVTRADLMCRLASLHRLGLRFDEAESLYEAARALFVAQSHLAGEHRATLGLAALAQDQGELDLAEHLYERLSGAYGSAGNRFGLAAAVNGLGAINHYRGNSAEALRLFQESWQLLRGLGSPKAVISGLNVGLIHLLAGDWGQLRLVIDRLAAEWSSAQRPWAGQLAVYRLALHVQSGDWPAFDGDLARAREMLRERAGAPQDVAQAAAAAGEAAAQRGQTDRARAALLLARGQWELAEDVGQVASVDVRLDALSALEALPR